MECVQDAIIPVVQRVEQQERADEAAGATITVKRKKGKGKSTGRQTKLTSSGSTSSGGNSLKVTKPSAFAEMVEPSIPEFNAQPKKTAAKGLGRGRVKKETTLGSEVGGASPEKLAAVKAVKDAFGLSDDDETPPPSLSERLAATKPAGKQTTLKFQKAPRKKVLILDDDSSEEDDLEMDFDTPPKPAPSKAKVRVLLFVVSDSMQQSCIHVGLSSPCVFWYHHRVPSAVSLNLKGARGTQMLCVNVSAFIYSIYTMRLSLAPNKNSEMIFNRSDSNAKRYFLPWTIAS